MDLQATIREYDWRRALERAGYRVVPDAWSYAAAPAPRDGRRA